MNVLAHEVSEKIFPLPMTSTAAARVLNRLGIVADLIYIDAGHEEEEVSADVNLYYELLRPGGILFGDDYHTAWPGIMSAVDAFAAKRHLNVTLSGVKNSKWVLRKPQGTT